jgi:hypothetical protein
MVLRADDLKIRIMRRLWEAYHKPLPFHIMFFIPKKNWGECLQDVCRLWGW